MTLQEIIIAGNNANIKQEGWWLYSLPDGIRDALGKYKIIDDIVIDNNRNFEKSIKVIQSNKFEGLLGIECITELKRKNLNFSNIDNTLVFHEMGEIMVKTYKIK